MGLGPVILRCGLTIAAAGLRPWLLGLGDGEGEYYVRLEMERPW